MQLANRDVLPQQPRAERRQRRVLFLTTSSDFGGTESVLRELVFRIDMDDFDPLVCSLRPCGRIAKEIAATGTPVLSLEMSERPRVMELMTGAIKLARWIDGLGIELVQSFLYRANVLAGLSARLSRRRPIVVAGQRSLFPLNGQRAATAARWTRGLCDRIVTVSNAVRQQLLRTEGVDPARVLVIENGVDTTHYDLTDNPALRAELGIPLDRIVIGAVGRLSPEKGFCHLLDALALTHDCGFPLWLIMAGDGPERDRLEQQARTLQLERHVKFLGVRRDLRPLYAACDIFALPSLEEGSPNALLEAMACGCAVIASPVGGIPEIVDADRSGLLVEPAAPPLWARAMSRLARDRGLRRRLGLQARHRIRERFDVARMVHAHAQLYRTLLATC